MCEVFLRPVLFLCLSLMLCRLTACYLAGLQIAQDWNKSTLMMSIGAGQHPDSDQQPPSKNQWRGEFNYRTARPLRVCRENWATRLYFSLSLPLHVSLSLFHSLSLDPVRATKLRLERGVGNKWRTLPDSLLFISQLSTVSSFHICYTSETLWSAY